jgi:hypothetical protein
VLFIGLQQRQIADALRGSATMAVSKRNQWRAMRSMVAGSNKSLAYVSAACSLPPFS